MEIAHKERLRLRWAGGLSIAASVVHGFVAPEHFEEWWGYGVFFMLAALAQLVYGFHLLQLSSIVTAADRAWMANAPLLRKIFWAGIVGNVALVVLYVVTRTLGIPFFGPEAGTVEAVSPAGVVTKAVEIALVVLLLRLLKDVTAPSRTSATG